MLNFLNRKDRSAPDEGSERAIDSLRERLLMPPRAGAYLLAQRRAATACQKRDAARQRLVDLRAEAASATTRIAQGLPHVSHDDIVAAEVEFAVLETEAAAARAERIRLRGEYQGKFLDGIGPAAEDYLAETIRRLEALDEVVSLGLALRGAAAQEGIETPRVIGRSREIVEHIRGIRAILSGAFQ